MNFEGLLYPIVRNSHPLNVTPGCFVKPAPLYFALETNWLEKE
jgi:hypothetical protein